MAQIPPRDTRTVAALYAAIAAAADQAARPYLGMSEIGKPCDRALWYGFRWATSATRDGRLLRLFRRGHLEEEQMAADLRAAGVEVVQVNEAGEQFGFEDISGHFRGHMDGALHGLLEAPQTWHVWECKTMSKAQFAKLVKEHVAAVKLEHWAQMQCYMHYSDMKRAYYTAVCKDDDQIYAERVHYSRDDALALIERARRIIYADSPPDKIGDESHPACQWCDHRGVCHGDMPPNTNCRTCYAATPDDEFGDGLWHCSKHDKLIDIEQQRAGCDQYETIAGMPTNDVIDGLMKKLDAKVKGSRAMTDGEFYNDPVPF